MGLQKFIFRVAVGVVKKVIREHEGEHAGLRLKTQTSPRSTAHVRRVIDGDTVEVMASGKILCIRLSAIDCPESGQPWGSTAKAGLIKLIGGRDVLLELHETDKYNRTVATVYVNNDSKLINVNERMVMLGHAWVMHELCDHLSQDQQQQLKKLESWARSKRVGLWQLDNPIAPWLWRNQCIPSASFDTQPTLTTERLLLRPYTKEDWERVHIYGADPDFSKYELWGPNTLEATHKFIGEMIQASQARPLFKFEYAVCLKENGLLIGGCGIRRESELSQVANLGWAISPEFQNKGFATEAARALVEFGRQELKLSVIYATCDTRNVASYKVMEKLGMKRVGLIKGTKEVKGHIRDSYRYEFL